MPGVLLIAGSGPTDRNSNNANYPGKIDTYKTLADLLSADGEPLRSSPQLEAALAAFVRRNL